MKEMKQSKAKILIFYSNNIIFLFFREIFGEKKFKEKFTL